MLHRYLNNFNVIMKRGIIMDKEELLLKNYTILSRNPTKNKDALKSSIQQLIELNPKLGIRCWEEVINENISEIQKEFGKAQFSYDSLGYILIQDFESDFCDNESFVPALETYAKNKNLLDIIYTKAPIGEYFSASYAISYLIRKGRLQEADNILSAIYKNKGFTDFSELWDNIIDNFEFGDSYHPGAYFSVPTKQPEHISNFCIRWIERIPNEEEKAGAMTFAMKMF